MEKQNIKKYEICEFLAEENKIKTSIFDLKIDALTYEKMFILFEKLEPKQRILNNEKTVMQTKKDELLMTLNFKELTGESRPTIQMKEAIMQPKLQTHLDTIKTLEYEIEYFKNKITIINDLIKNQRLMMKIETDFQEE